MNAKQLIFQPEVLYSLSVLLVFSLIVAIHPSFLYRLHKRIWFWLRERCRTKKYHLFAFNDYYPSGGMGDYVGYANSLGGAKGLASTQKDYNDNSVDEIQIVDSRFSLLLKGRWDDFAFDGESRQRIKWIRADKRI